jgi:hypothetical protein
VEGWHRDGEALGGQFSHCPAYENEILAAEARGDLAYTVALEHTTASIGGAEPRPYVLRVTTIFRREDGNWKVVHRHGDPLSADSAVAVRALTLPGTAPTGESHRRAHGLTTTPEASASRSGDAARLRSLQWAHVLALLTTSGQRRHHARQCPVRCRHT